MARKKVENKDSNPKKKPVKLKRIYSGMIWKGEIIRDDTLTEKIVKDLKENHPLGDKLFY